MAEKEERVAAEPGGEQADPRRLIQPGCIQKQRLQELRGHGSQCSGVTGR